MEPMQPGRFYLGVDNSCDEHSADSFFNTEAARLLGLSFYVYHEDPTGTLKQETEKAHRQMAQCEQAGLYFLFNTETANWLDTYKDEDGFDWANGSDGCHYFRFPPEVLAAYAASPAFAGVCYDEAEHMQINRNYTYVNDVKKDQPFFSETNGLTFREAQDSFVDFASGVSGRYRAAGVGRVLTEHVWPTLFHAFARGGFTPCYKQMKENWSNIWAAMAMGAARQYHRELWTCLDLWWLGVYPGHSPEELDANLRFAYLIGNDRAYVENIAQKGSLYSMQDGHPVLSERGEVYRHFAKEWIPSHPRSWSHRDYLPRTAIIRFDDTYCGQTYAEPVWRPMLFGAYNLHPTEQSREYLDALYTISHGVVPTVALSWNYKSLRDVLPHRSFAPANGLIFYDETVTAENLDTLRLAFLCGMYISPRTLADIAAMVHDNGLTVVTSARFAPAPIAGQYFGGTQEFADGAGRWIVCEDMKSDEVRSLVAPLLGEPDEMRFEFAGRDLRMRITDGGDGIQLL